MDKNKDGFLNLKEFIGNPKDRNVPALKKQFSRRDANADGKPHASGIKQINLWQ